MWFSRLMQAAGNITSTPRCVAKNGINSTLNNVLPENILSTVATADTAMTTVFDQLSHHAGTNDVNHIRLEMKASKPRTIPQHVSDLQE